MENSKGPCMNNQGIIITGFGWINLLFHFPLAFQTEVDREYTKMVTGDWGNKRGAVLGNNSTSRYAWNVGLSKHC